MSGEHFAFGPFVFEQDRGVLTRDGVTIPVGARALAVLAELLRSGNGIVRKDELIEAGWPGTSVEESNLSVQIANLRKLLGQQPDGSDWIATVARVGYRFTGHLAAPGDASPVPAHMLLAVPPFIGDTGTSDALAAGFADNIATALSRFRWFSVTDRDDPHARYRLDGRVRRSEDRLRISVRLVDTQTGVQIFGANYDPQSTELFAAQDQVAQQVAAAVEAMLLKMDGARPGGTTPGDLVRRGTGLFHRVTRDTHRMARDLFREAAQLAPDLAEAHVWLARVSAGLIAYGWSSDAAADGAEGVAAGLAAVRIDPESPYAHYGLAIISIYAGAPDQAVRAAERAVELNNSFALGHLVLGLARLASGDPAEARTPLQRGLELNPGDPQGFAWLNFLALTLLFSDAPDAAHATAAEVLKLRPDWRAGLETMACCEMALGRVADARRTHRRLLALPEDAGSALAPVHAGNPHWQARLTELLDMVAAGDG